MALTVAERRQLELAKIKLELVYDGPDNARWLAACVMLARLLGYRVEQNHYRILQHYAQQRGRRRSLVLGFRGLGKSTVGTITVAIKYALENPNIRILFVSATDGAAKEFLKETRIHLQTNELLTEMFGRFFDPMGGMGDTGRFREGYATISQRTELYLREPTFLSIGIGGQTASRHFDLVFADDLVVEKNSKTQTQREVIRSWHDSTLLGAIMPHTTIFYLGTRYYPNDLYDDLEHGRAGEKTGALAGCVLRLPMVENYDDDQEDWISTSPDRHPVQYCRETRKEMGAYHFQAQMQQDTRSGEGIIFSYPDFRWYTTPPPRLDMAIYQFTDLVAKKTDKGAFFATVTAGLWKDPVGQLRIYILDLIRFRGGTLKQRNSIIASTERWKPISHGVEAVQMQAGFAEEIQECTPLPVVPVPLTGQEGDKELRARRISPKVEAHMVYFPEDETPAGERCAMLIQELTQFPTGNFCDTVDAFVGVITLAMFGGAPASSPVMPEDEDEDDGLLADYD